MAKITYLGDNIYKVAYQEDEICFFMQVQTRDNTNKKTYFKNTPLLGIYQEPQDWTSFYWEYDSTAETELGESLPNPSINDPIADWLFWLLRMLGKRFNKPFG